MKKIIQLLLALFLLTGCYVEVEIVGNDHQEEYVQLDTLPEYNGQPYVELNNNVPLFDEEDKKVQEFEYYNDLDDLGRCTGAYAVVSKQSQPKSKRESISEVKPSGWQTARYDDLIRDRYLYNRCHLIGFQLTGENANEKNLITGTRYLNVDGMLPFEDMVDDYVDRTRNHVLYRVIPMYEGDELVCRGLTIEAYSIEDQGKGIQFYVYCFNVQPNILINYSDGKSMRDESASNQSTVKVKFIANKNTKKFHLPKCKHIDTISKHNRVEITSTRSKMVEDGYVPCVGCLGG